MGGSGMNGTLSDFVKKHYPDSKSDLFAMFMERGLELTKTTGFNCMVTMQSWIFLSCFEKMRKKILSATTITNLMHMENMVMGIAFGTAVSAFQNNHISNYKGTYNQVKLRDVENEAPKSFPNYDNRFAQVSTDNFSKIPGSPVAYWVGEAFVRAFERGETLGELSIARVGLQTSNNSYFLRFWFECDSRNIFFDCNSIAASTKSSCVWYPHNKGGSYNKWYGNLEYVIKYKNAGQELAESDGASVIPEKYVFQQAITYSRITSGDISFRIQPFFCIFDSASVNIF